MRGTLIRGSPFSSGVARTVDPVSVRGQTRATDVVILVEPRVGLGLVIMPHARRHHPQI